jgi:hypothetical protein
MSGDHTDRQSVTPGVYSAVCRRFVQAMTLETSLTNARDLTETWERLLPLIGSGLSLPAALAQIPEPKPSIWALKRSVRQDPDLERRYRDALESRGDALADEIAALVDQPIPAGLRGADASAWVQLQRLRMDATRWVAFKLFPERWGDSVAVAVAVEVDQRISISAALAPAERRLLTVEAETPRARIGALHSVAQLPEIDTS